MYKPPKVTIKISNNIEGNSILKILVGLNYSEHPLRFSNDLQDSKLNRARLRPRTLKSGVVKIF